MERILNKFLCKDVIKIVIEYSNVVNQTHVYTLLMTSTSKKNEYVKEAKVNKYWNKVEFMANWLNDLVILMENDNDFPNQFTLFQHKTELSITLNRRTKKARFY